jgi:8-oxo-dGTP pyrophosphatase MutT (NUDIX family)
VPDRHAGPSADPRVAALRSAIAAHSPKDDAEAASCEELLHALEVLPSPFDEAADPTHVTGAAIVSDGDDRIVLHRHKRLGIWLQPGGHVDPGEDPAQAAVRETLEETGLQVRHPGGTPHLLHVDAHPGPRAHRHLDVRYLVLADPSDELAPAAGESPHVAWFTVDDAIGVADASLAAALHALRER